MPLVRMQLRNELGMGEPELYRGAGRDDPKALLDGVAVSGLVGILRQLGNLADFASEIFQDLHDQMTLTAARSGKMLIRIRNIEAALPPIEKLVSGLNGYVHFAYTTGSDWHPNIRIEQNQLSNIDMPRFMLDSYEECREPPRLSLLDRFDPAGSGSCLRKYSDPSYFRIAWAYSSELLNAEQFQKEMKSLRRKKKSMRQRSGSVSRVSSMSMRHGSGRNHFPVVETDNSNCVLMRRSKSELTNHPVSVDSKTWSEEFGSRINYTHGYEKKEKMESSASKMTSSHVSKEQFQQEQPKDFGNIDLPPDQLEDLETLRSSSVSGSEKKEVVEPATCICDDALVDQALTSKSEPACIGNAKTIESVATFEDEDQSDFVFDVAKVAETLSTVDHNNEVMSEVDNYMDALNTMDSESETEADCQTKREVDLPFNNKQGLENERFLAPEIATQSASSFTFGSSLSSSSSPSRKMPPISSSSGLLQSKVLMVLPQSAQDSWEGCPEIGDEQPNNSFDATEIKTFVPNHEDLSFGSGVPHVQDDGINTDYDYAKSSPNHSNIPPITIWTNGGLLGLQPLKPPEMGVQNDIKNGHGNFDIIFPNEKFQRNEESTPAFTYISKETGGSDQKDNVEEQYHSSSNHNRHSKNRPKVSAPLFKLNECESPSSATCGIFSSQSKLQSPASEERRKDHASRTSLGIIPQESFHSGSTSPPLEHMKISFHPIDTSEMSRLKLEFPNKHQFPAIAQDVIFPSFQLLHEPPPAPSQDMASESDNDTFCKSSSYTSEDALGPHSESNSEQWSPRQTYENGQREIYDSFCGVQSIESSCCSLEFEEMTGKSISQAQESVSSSGGISLERIDEVSSATWSHNANTYGHLNEYAPLALIDPGEMPPPPPLPPLQWRMAKLPHSDVKKSQNFVDAISHIADQNVASPSDQRSSEIPKPPVANDTPATSNKVTIDHHQRLRKVSSELSGKSSGESGDFLYQIRTKSLNLRPIATSKPSSTSNAITNVNVAAILEKANAIRQVVASEDDTCWSDS